MIKNVLITGALGNLGKVVCREFLDNGYHVIGTAMEGELSSLLALPLLDELELYEINLTDELATRELVEKLATKHGQIDAAVMIAGGFAMGNLQATGQEELKQMFSINFETAYNTARAVVKQMEQQASGGQLFFIGAKPFFHPDAGQNMVAYTLSKTLLFKLSELINAAEKGKNITSTVVVPSIIDTPTNRKFMPDARFEDWVTPEAIAKTIVFACSEAGSYMRESVIKMYGNS